MSLPFGGIQLRHIGRYSPKTDERCLTWCSQSSRGRYEGQDPFCRTICIRRVFEHEVKNALQPMSALAPSQLRPQNVKYPLPPEGQSREGSSDGTSGRSSARDVRFWEEGWYIWMSRSRWAAQEKMDLMMLDLERQTTWIRAKEQEEKAWYDSEMQRVRDNVRNANEREIWPEDDASQPASTTSGEYHDAQGSFRQPYPNIACVI